jgi:diazepam-binding inhibitor (GABA receptor modulating acyl-CoA-binding protein)
VASGMLHPSLGEPPMAVTDKKFEAAANDIKKLTRRPDDEDMLRLYALYKQGSEGDVQGERPGAFSFVDRAKYDAWAKLKGTDQAKARENYVKLVERLKKSYG